MSVKNSYAYLLSPLAEMVKKKYDYLQAQKQTGKAKEYIEEELNTLTHVYDTVEARFNEMQQAVYESDYLVRVKAGELAFLKQVIEDQRLYIDMLEAESIVKVVQPNTAADKLKEHAAYIVSSLKKSHELT